MTIHYSASRRGFFDTAVHAVLPADAVRITRSRHAALLAAQDSGAAIVPNAAGRPMLAWPSEPVDPRATLLRAVKREAARRIRAVGPLWRQINALRDGEGHEASVLFGRIDALRAASNAIEAQLASAPTDALAGFPIADHPFWPEFG